MIIQKPTTDPSAIVIPFGKHKGKTVAELLATDPAYADWVTAQGWVAERFAELHAAILTRGAGTDDTPEHNAIQARFLDDAFRFALLRITSGEEIVAARAECLKYETYEPRDQKRKRRADLNGSVLTLKTERGCLRRNRKYTTRPRVKKTNWRR